MLAVNQQDRTKLADRMLVTVKGYLLADEFGMELCMSDLTDTLGVCLSTVSVECRSLTLMVGSDLDEDDLKAMYLAKLAHNIRRMGWKAYKAKHADISQQCVEGDTRKVLRIGGGDVSSTSKDRSFGGGFQMSVACTSNDTTLFMMLRNEE